MDSLYIRIPLVPVPKGRPRFNHNSRLAYTDAKTLKFERELRKVCKEEMVKRNFTKATTPLSVCLFFRMPIPKSYSKKKTKEMEASWYPHRPDIDNLIKSALDAMNGVVYEDDALVVRLESTKSYSAEDFGMTIEVYKIRE